MSILVWIVLGAISGWLVSLLMKTNAEQGWIGNIAVGIVGALIGGYLGSKILGITVTGLNIKSILLSVAGGIIFALLLGAVTGRRSL